MWNKQLKRETMISIYFGSELKYSCKDIRGAKSWIYSKGIRNNIYIVDEFDMDGIIINQWVYKFLDNGVIFTKKVYDKWKEMKRKAEASQEYLQWDLPYL